VAEVFALNDYGSTPFATAGAPNLPRGPGGLLSQADAGNQLQLEDATMHPSCPESESPVDALVHPLGRLQPRCSSGRTATTVTVPPARTVANAPRRTQRCPVHRTTASVRTLFGIDRPHDGNIWSGKRFV
jgi:hypothetical protein